MKPGRVWLVSLLCFCTSQIGFSQTTDEIVSKHIEAIGGKDAWAKVTSLKIDGTLKIQGNEIKITLLQLHGKGMRQDIALQGMTGFQILTPTEGWTFLPFQGHTEVMPMSQEDVKQSQNELDTHGSLLDYKEKGHSAELKGTENINGMDCYKLVLTLNSGKVETLFIDSKNYYLVRSTTKTNVNGEEQEMETNYTGFEKTPEGIVMAKSLMLPYGTMTINKLQVNFPVDETVFNPVYDKQESHEPK